MPGDVNDQLMNRLYDIRHRVYEMRLKVRAMPFERRIADIHAEAMKITGPFLFGDFDHLRDTDRDEYDRHRLRALAADQKRNAELLAVDAERKELERLEAEYAAVALELADAM